MGANHLLVVVPGVMGDVVLLVNSFESDRPGSYRAKNRTPSSRCTMLQWPGAVRVVSEMEQNCWGKRWMGRGSEPLKKLDLSLSLLTVTNRRSH